MVRRLPSASRQRTFMAPGSPSMRSMRAETCTSRRGSAASTSASRRATSGSTSARMRSRASSSVTRVPKSWNICAISAPMAPPPTTTMRFGGPSSDQMVSEVRTPPLSSPSRAPGMGGTKGGAPVAITAQPKVMRRPSLPSPGPGRAWGSSGRREVSMNRVWASSKRARPWMYSILTALSVRSASRPRVSSTSRRVASRRFQSRRGLAVPSTPRRASWARSRMRSAAARQVLDGMQPRHRHSPPGSGASLTSATLMPCSASSRAQSSPPGPPPMTTTGQSHSPSGMRGPGGSSQSSGRSTSSRRVLRKAATSAPFTTR